MVLPDRDREANLSAQSWSIHSKCSGDPNVLAELLNVLGVDELCLIEPAYCGVICVLVPGSPFDPATGKINLVGSESQLGCDGGMCFGPFVFFAEHGDLRLTEPQIQWAPTLGPGAILLLGLLLAVNARYTLRR